MGRSNHNHNFFYDTDGTYKSVRLTDNLPIEHPTKKQLVKLKEGVKKIAKS
jgi:hypothetical protein